MTSVGFPRLVLFDLDGTLLDSAPDFVATINRMRAERCLPDMPLAALRPHVSRGSRAMLTAGFPSLDADAIDTLVPAFLRIYEQELGRHGRPFDDIEMLLVRIESTGSRWGIVTNKPEFLARDLLPLLGWQGRCAILVGGDTLAARKPDPLPLLHCVQALGERAIDCCYVGDDERDIAAARAAGMPSIAALWGYRGDDDDPAVWNADLMVDAPSQLHDPAIWPCRRV